MSPENIKLYLEKYIRVQGEGTIYARQLADDTYIQWTIIVREDGQKKLKFFTLEFVQCNIIHMFKCLYYLIRSS